MTTAEFLAWEERQELRFEFDGDSVRAMTGGTAAHAAIQRNLLTALTNRLRGQSCRAYGSELKVRIPTGQVRYPDAFVICVALPPRATMVTEPVVVFEIVSESSVTQDYVVKNREYRSLPSLGRYVVVQQDRPACAVFAPRDAKLEVELLVGPEAVLELPEIGLRIPLAELYLDLEFEPDDAAGSERGIATSSF